MSWWAWLVVGWAAGVFMVLTALLVALAVMGSTRARRRRAGDGL